MNKNQPLNQKINSETLRFEERDKSVVGELLRSKDNSLGTIFDGFRVLGQDL